MPVRVVRYIVNGAALALGFFMFKVVLRSFGDAFRRMGLVLFTMYSIMLISMVWAGYNQRGIEYAGYTVVGILILHTFIWSLGFFKH